MIQPVGRLAAPYTDQDEIPRIRGTAIRCRYRLIGVGFLGLRVTCMHVYCATVVNCTGSNLCIIPTRIHRESLRIPPKVRCFPTLETISIRVWIAYIAIHVRRATARFYTRDQERHHGDDGEEAPARSASAAASAAASSEEEALRCCGSSDHSGRARVPRAAGAAAVLAEGAGRDVRSPAPTLHRHDEEGRDDHWSDPRAARCRDEAP